MEKRYFSRLKLTVTKVEGKCYHGYKVGDEFIWEDFTHPPKHFCQGAAHAIFPCIYALTFGAEFPFMENMRSIQTACPDGGKLEFKSEILDEKDEVQTKPKPAISSGPNPKKLEVVIEEVSGKCFYNYKVGDKFEFSGLKTPEGFCGAAYHALFPVLFALNFGAKYHFMDNPDSINTTTCPDHGAVRFRTTRISK
ncbi:MAG: TIGR04076 family protein [Candidatus Omnitrophota bacterium]